MRKKYLSALLFGALLVTSAGTFTSCKDYDDDIKNLREQLDKKASLEELTSKISQLETAIAEAKTAAQEAKEKAQQALDAAQSGEGGVSEEDLTALKNELQTQIDKLASLEEVNSKIAALKTELEGQIDGLASEEALNALQTKVEALSAEVMKLIGKRLTSLSVIPTTHVNGIAAIEIKSLTYRPQVYVKAPHDDDYLGNESFEHAEKPWLDHTAVANAKDIIISSEKNKAYFHVSPSIGVADEDIEMPSFNCITSTNVTRSGEIAVNNTPIQPVDYNIEGDELEVTFKKTVTDYIGSTGEAHGDAKKESFYMASLKAPIAEKNWTSDEVAQKEENPDFEVSVNSEYVRLEENLYIPYIANENVEFNKAIVGDFADEIQNNASAHEGRYYVHYHDSACVYNSEATELIDYKVAYNEPVDLKKLVTVCTTPESNAGDHSKHEELGDYEDYGLSFRFYLATAPYITLGGPDNNTNKTDQQKFAQIDSPENGIMTSRVYDINGGSATAVGREPIVRVELRDTKDGRNNLIAQRYIKFKWVKEVGQREIPVEYTDAIYKCANYVDRLGTQQMNEYIYAQAKEGGMTKQEFHAVYTDDGFDANVGLGDGEATYVKNSEAGVESYNLEWTLEHKDIVTKYPDWYKQEEMVFEKTVFWKDPTGAYPTLKITLKRTIYKPIFGEYGYDGRYWKTSSNYSIFNVNPIVYNTIESNPAWNDNTNHKNNPTCNIYTDLLNGFLNKEGKMPMTGAYEHIYFTDKGSQDPNKKLDYSVDGNYDTDGVKYIFDADKLANGTNPDGNKYEFPYFNGTTTVLKTAEVRNNGTEIWINGELAASIVNNVVNKCTDTNNPRFGAITYNIKLQEAVPDALPYAGSNPTEAAKSLVGQYLPIKMIANICDADQIAHAKAHTVNIKAYDAFIIRPLTIVSGDTDDFTDATIDGSTIDVKGAFTYTCWNADETGKFYTASNSAGATTLQRELWKFYECVAGEWMTKQATTNLKLDNNGNLVPTEGVTDGPLPNNTTVTYDNVNETLTYYNHSGTPVNADYKIYIPVKFGYKWQTETKTFEVEVKTNAGTPSRR